MKIKILANKHSGFSLIELLIVLLIVGILLSFSVYSINLVNQQQKISLVNKVKNQIKSAQHQAQMLNRSMRIRHLNKKNKQQIMVEYFNIQQQVWQSTASINNIELGDEKVNIETKFVLIKPNGFITDSNICIDNDCIQSAQK